MISPIALTNYRSSVDRIEKASSTREVQQVWHSLARVHAAGWLTDSELMRLDGKIVDKLIAQEAMASQWSV